MSAQLVQYIIEKPPQASIYLSTYSFLLTLTVCPLRRIQKNYLSNYYKFKSDFIKINKLDQSIISVNSSIMIAPTSDSSQKSVFKKIKKTYLSVDIYKLSPKHLLDFGSLSKLNKQTKYIERPISILLRTQDEALIFRRKDQQPKKAQLFPAQVKLCEIVKREIGETNRYVGVFHPSTDIQRWIIVPTITYKQSIKMPRIEENDCLSIGNLLFIIKYIGSKYKLTPPKSIQIEQKKEINLCDERCAICNKADSKVLSICQCLQSFHVTCFSEVSQQKYLKVQQRNKYTTFTITLKCPSCQQNFPEQLVGQNAAMQHIYDYHKELKKIQQEEVIIQNEMRVIFQIKGLEINNPVYKNKKAYLYAMFKENQISIGRDINSSVYIQEKSVSRNHAKIIYLQIYKIFYIQNLSMKFGTLKKLNRQDIQIENQTSFKLANQLLVFTKHETQI